MYNVFLYLRRTARVQRVFLSITSGLLGVACALPVYATQTLFYTGDPNNAEAIGDYRDPLGGPLSLSQVFEPFTVTSSSGWDVNSLFFNEVDVASNPITSAEWSIRSGMGPGLPGVTIASGISSTAGTVGTDKFTVSHLNVFLDPGTYWLNITPNSESGRLFAESTSGANSIDANLRGAALWYEPGVQYYSATNYDFSAGATGEVAPEPSTFWLLLPVSACCAMLFVSKRRQLASGATRSENC